MIDPGSHLQITYPIRTHVLHINNSPRRPRSLTVKRVRDLVRDPLTIAEFLRRPFVTRSRWLVTAIDNDLGKYRQFYLGSSDEFPSPGAARIAIYDPGAVRPTELLGCEFLPTVADRKRMMRVLRDLETQGLDMDQVKICCDDFRLVG